MLSSLFPYLFGKKDDPLAHLERRPTLESLEDRLAPNNIFEATAAAAAGIEGTVDNYRAALGDPVNGAMVGSQPAGRRQINWDAVPDFEAAPGRFPGDFFNAISPRGVIFSGDARTAFQVSADAANPTASDPEFGNLNPTYLTAFGTFSPERLFTPLGSNVLQIDFVVPGSTQRALVQGFGAVFTDVDTAGSSKIEFFDAGNNLIFTRDTLTKPAGVNDASLQFLGLDALTAQIARVRITTGDAPLTFTGSPDDITQGGANDLVVLDDFIYGEPQPLPDAVVVTGADAGGGPHVRAFNASNGQVVREFFAYDAAFTGGVRVAMGDVTGDGTKDIITAAGPGGGPDIRVFDGTNGNQVRGFFAYDPGFTGGVFVASADLTNDGKAEIITGAGAGGGPNVRVFDGDTGAQLSSFFAYDQGFAGGVQVAVADVDNDGTQDIITGAGPGGGPNVRVFDSATGVRTQNFFAYVNGFTGGVFVAAGDVNGDGQADILTGAGTGGGPHVRGFSTTDIGNPVVDFFAFENGFTGGVRVAAANLDNNETISNLIVGTGPGVQAQVRNFNVSATQPQGVTPYGGFTGGTYVAGAR